jgi:hypothetical protein
MALCSAGGLDVNVPWPLSDTDGLPSDDIIAIPVPRPSGRPGYFAVTAATHVARPRAEQRQVAALLAHLAAGSLALEAGASDAR